MPTIKDLIEAMTASWPAALAILLASAAILGGDAYELPYMQTLPSWALGTAFVALACSGAVLLVSILRGLLDAVRRPFRRRRRLAAEARHIEGLRDIPQEEGFILAWAEANGTQVISAPYFHPAIKALVAKGYLQLTAGQHNSQHTPFLIPDHVWKILREELSDHPEREKLVGAQPFGSRFSLW